MNRHLEQCGIRITTGANVDATIIHAPSSTKNKARERDPEIHQVKKGNQWYFGMKAHIVVGSKEGTVHSVCTTAANVSDQKMLPDLLHGGERKVWGDAGYQGQGEAIHRAAPEAQHMTSRRTRFKGFIDEAQRRKNRTKPRVRSKVEQRVPADWLLNLQVTLQNWLKVNPINRVRPVGLLDLLGGTRKDPALRLVYKRNEVAMPTEFQQLLRRWEPAFSMPQSCNARSSA